jgi:hypothetical protein
MLIAHGILIHALSCTWQMMDAVAMPATLSAAAAVGEHITWKDDLYGGCIVDSSSGPEDPKAFTEALSQAMQVGHQCR